MLACPPAHDAHLCQISIRAEDARTAELHAVDYCFDGFHICRKKSNRPIARLLPYIPQTANSHDIQFLCITTAERGMRCPGTKQIPPLMKCPKRGTGKFTLTIEPTQRQGLGHVIGWQADHRRRHSTTKMTQGQCGKVLCEERCRFFLSGQ